MHLVLSAERAAGRRSEYNALSGGAAGTEHLFQLAKVAGVGVLRWRHGADGQGIAGDCRPAGPCLRGPRRSRGAYGLATTGRDERQIERFDARPGGSYRLVLTYADASSARGKATADSDIVEAHFVDVIPGVRVVQAIDFVSDDPTHAGTMTMTDSLWVVLVGWAMRSKRPSQRALFLHRADPGHP